MENLKSEPHLPTHVNSANFQLMSGTEGPASLMNMAMSSAYSAEPTKKFRHPVIKQAPIDPIQRIIYKAGITSEVLLKSKATDLNPNPVKQPVVKELIMPMPSCHNEDLSKLISTNRIEDDQSLYDSPHELKRLIKGTHQTNYADDAQRIAIEIDNKRSINPTEHTNYGSQSQLKLKPTGVNSQEQI